VSLRGRLTAMAVVVVGFTLVLAATACYVALRAQLRGQVDRQLRRDAAVVVRLDRRRPNLLAIVPSSLGRRGGGDFIVVLARNGEEVLRRGGPIPAATTDELGVAAGRRAGAVRDATAAGESLRILTEPLARGGAVRIGAPLADVDETLARLRVLLLVLVVLGTGLAALLARIFGRTVIAPVAELSEATGHIARTGDLSRRVDVRGGDEVGRLGGRFNEMLEALQRSQQAQRQLVADASHELRTPVTGLHGNVELLLAHGGVPDPEVLESMRAQSAELGSLIADVIELARDDASPPDAEPVRMDELVADAVARARRHAPGATFETALEPFVLSGSRDRLARAVNNLLDNAAQHSATVEVRLSAAGELRVRDRGDGIAERDLPHVFDRFYRGGGARRRPGSGLGLAIVRQVVEAHGGTVEAANAPGGGALLVASFPAQTFAPDSASS
jgi:two-component system sensor histidine kinase MprB